MGLSMLAALEALCRCQRETDQQTQWRMVTGKAKRKAGREGERGRGGREGTQEVGRERKEEEIKET